MLLSDATWLAHALGSFIALAFLAGAASKAMSPASFRATIAAFGVRHLSAVLARALPILEGTAAVGLMLPLSRGASGAVLITLLLVYSGAVLASLLRGDRVPCNCFGSLSDGQISEWTLARNAVLGVGLALFATVPLPRELDFSEALAAALMAGVALGFLVLAEMTVELTRAIQRHAREHAGA